MDYARWSSLPALFFHQAARLGDKPFLWGKQDGTFRALSWNQVAARVRHLALGLRAQGVQPGDRVLLLSENRPEWFIADFAIMTLGAITVPAYVTNLPGDHRHVLTHAGVVLALVSTQALAARLLPALAEAPACRALVALEDPGQAQATTTRMLRWADVEAQGAALPDDLDSQVAALKRTDTAIFIYTSGTGGVPKGVMLSHGAILANCYGAWDLLVSLGLGDEVFLSFLPLSHSYEHTAGLCFPMSIGAQIYYAESVESLLTNMAEAQPTIMTAVPRLYETMHLRIRLGLTKQKPLQRKFFAEALRLGLKRYKDAERLTPWERVKDRVLERLVRDKVRQRFGGRLKAFVSGGAALNPDIGWFFQALGVTLLQGYGQTESAPVVSANRPERIKMPSVGPAVKDVEVRIAEDGEILVRGELVMQGYWQDPEGTANAIRDGWLHTGDIGHLDADGYIFITDRKKDILVLSGGDNVSPARVESRLTLEDEIEQAMVYGDRRPALVALLVPSKAFIQEYGGDQAALTRDPRALEALGKVVDRANRQLSVIERIRRFAVAPAAFSTENEMLTPTMKIRRHKIKAAYGPLLEGLYEKKGS